MSILLSVIVFFIIIISQLKKNHKLNVFLSILSIVCDTFYFNIFGLNFLIIYMVGYFNIPFLLKSHIITNKSFNKLIHPFKVEFFYLIILGIIFGFIFPWEDLSGTRLWNQQAQGRTIVQLFKLFNEFLILYYFAALIILKKITLRDIIYSIAIASLLSFWIGFIDYFMHYTIKSALFDLSYFEMGRFLGLNGEPKALGRIGAFSFSIILLYIIHYKPKSRFLIFALLSNFFAVVLSSSASSYILFLLLLLAIFFSSNPKKLIVATTLSICLIYGFNYLVENNLLQENTSSKVSKALFGSDDLWVKDEPKIFSRFDIWDRLALIYLWQHPQYIITGVGPNLISIPMSENIPEHTVFYQLGRVDSVPNVMLNNILSRSGIIGVSLFFIGILLILRKLNGLPPFFKKCFFISIIFNMVYFHVIFYMFIGISLGFFYLYKSEGKA